MEEVTLKVGQTRRCHKKVNQIKMNNRNSKCLLVEPEERSAVTREIRDFLKDVGHELAFEDWVILELMQEKTFLIEKPYDKTEMSCELRHKNSLSRTEEAESGNGGERIVGKGPDLLGRGAQKHDSQAAVGNRWKFR